MAKELDLDYHALNAMVNLYDNDGNLQLGMDKEAARQYFLQHINRNMQWFHSLEEKIDYLVDNEYWDKNVLDMYHFDDVKDLFKFAYSFKFRFETFLGAHKFFTSYALKTFDGERYLERFEDRVTMVALGLAQGDYDRAQDYIEEIIEGRYQPATPTFSNTGKKRSGELVSCFLINVDDNLESIMRTLTNTAQLSKIGGGVGVNISNIRATGDPIKGYKGQSSGVIPFMKQLDSLGSYINQLGQRNGAIAVYINALHLDILSSLDTKRENADDGVRIKTLSIGVVVPDIVFELAKNNEDMYTFSPYDVEKVYGVPFSEVDKTAEYRNMVDNPDIRKSKVNARKFFQMLSEIQFESGYPYIMFEDTVNRVNPVDGKVSYSNLCVTGDTEILTDKGYRKAIDLYNSQEDFDVVVDTRARDMDLTALGTSVEKSTHMALTASNQPVFKVTTAEGFSIRATEWHKMYVDRDGEIEKIPLGELEPGDKVLVQSDEGRFGNIHKPDLGYVAGVIAGDGSLVEQSTPDALHSPSAVVYLYDTKSEIADQVTQAVHSALSEFSGDVRRQSTITPEFVESKSTNRLQMTCAPLGEELLRNGMSKSNKTDIPEFVTFGDRDTQISYLSGLYQTDATVVGAERNATSIELGSTNYDTLAGVQKILINLGIFSRIYTGRVTDTLAELPDGKGGTALYMTRPTWTLRISSKRDAAKFASTVKLRPSQADKLENLLGAAVRPHYLTHRFRATVVAVELDGVEDVYDVTVGNGNSVIFNGIATGNCSEILQVNDPSTFNTAGEYDVVGRDISCNLGSLDVARLTKSPDFGKSIGTAIRALTSVSNLSSIDSVPTVKKANEDYHSVGLGHMNLHGFLMENGVEYGSEEALNFVDNYFRAVAYYGLKESNKIAQETGKVFHNFENSAYADGSYFDRIFGHFVEPNDFTKKVLGDFIPSDEDWESLASDITEFGIYHSYLFATAPTGSISYVKNATASIHPVASKLEIRKEGKIGRVYYPQYGLTPENFDSYKDAYEIGYEKLIDTYATAQRYVDQGMSLTLFFPDSATTRDLDRARMYAWRKGIKTIYYVRLRQKALSGTEAEYCVSCTI